MNLKGIKINNGEVVNVVRAGDTVADPMRKWETGNADTFIAQLQEETNRATAAEQAINQRIDEIFQMISGS